MSEYIDVIRKKTKEKGPALGLHPNEVIVNEWVFLSVDYQRRCEQEMVLGFRNTKRLQRLQVKGQVHQDVRLGQLPIADRTIGRLSPTKILNMEAIRNLTAMPDTDLVLRELDGGLARGVQTRMLNNKQKNAVGIYDAVVAVTIFKLRSDSKILEAIKG